MPDSVYVGDATHPITQLRALVSVLIRFLTHLSAAALEVVGAAYQVSVESPSLPGILNQVPEG